MNCEAAEIAPACQRSLGLATGLLAARLVVQCKSIAVPVIVSKLKDA